MPVTKRFYELDEQAATQLAQSCRKLWSLPVDANIGPVNTNFPAGSARKIDLVVVCESPSFAEVEHGLPTYGDTGRKILNRWLSARQFPPVDKDAFEYEQLAERGIYITNLVRCQADWITQPCYAQGTRLLTTIKDQRVKLAWNANRNFLAKELQLVAAANRNAAVLFACGTKFDTQVREATELAKNANLTWLVSFHPSRLAADLAWHYNPEDWGDAKETFPSDRKESNRNALAAEEGDDQDD